VNIKNIMLSCLLLLVTASHANDATESIGFLNSVGRWLERCVNKVKVGLNFNLEVGGGQQTSDQMLDGAISASSLTEVAGQIDRVDTKHIKDICSGIENLQQGVSDVGERIDVGVATIDKRIGMVDESVKASGTLSTLEKAGMGVMIVAGTVTIIRGAYDGCHFIRSCVWATKEEQLHQENISRQLKVLQSREKLNECLVRNSHAQKDEEGLPHVCKEPADFFAIAAGYGALNKVKEEYRQR
jgi:hypothetical protein